MLLPAELVPSLLAASVGINRDDMDKERGRNKTIAGRIIHRQFVTIVVLTAFAFSFNFNCSGSSCFERL